MCKHCKPKEATPAAEAGTPEYAVYAALKNIVDRRLLSPLDDANDEAMEALAAYEESRTRNPESPTPEFRYFTPKMGRDFFWKFRTIDGKAWCRPDMEPYWSDSVCKLRDMDNDETIEIPNPDQEP
jgi:hypothetical protein